MRDLPNLRNWAWLKHDIVKFEHKAKKRVAILLYEFACFSCILEFPL